MDRPELLVNRPCKVGENPFWHSDEKCLYWLDIPPGRLYAYDPKNETTKCYECGQAVGGFTVEEDGALDCFLWRKAKFGSGKKGQ